MSAVRHTIQTMRTPPEGYTIVSVVANADASRRTKHFHYYYSPLIWGGYNRLLESNTRAPDHAARLREQRKEARHQRSYEVVRAPGAGCHYQPAC